MPQMVSLLVALVMPATVLGRNLIETYKSQLISQLSLCAVQEKKISSEELMQISNFLLSGVPVSILHPVGRCELQVSPDVTRLLRRPHASDQVLPLGR